MSRGGNKNKSGKGHTVRNIVIGFILFVLVFGTYVIYEDNKEEHITRIPEHTANFYIEDYSHVLNERTERFIFDEARRLDEATKAQVVVVTVPDTGQFSLEGYSYKLANEWGIGDRELDNGVLLLFETNPDDRHVRLEIGKGLEGALPDGKAGRILDEYAVEAKDAGEWNRAAGDTFAAVVKEVYDEYGVAHPESLAQTGWEDGEEDDGRTFADADLPADEIVINDDPIPMQIGAAFVELLIGIGFFILIVAVIVIVIVFSGSGGGGGGRSYGGGHSYGGGGGGFSGGGGSFGGGGASR